MEIRVPNQVAEWYALDSVQRFPCFNPEDNEKRVGTTFYGDFKVAAATGGLKGLKDTFLRAFAEWKNDAKYMTEMCLVLNHLGWECYQVGQEEFAKFFFGKYDYVHLRIFSSGSENEPLPDGCTAFEEQEISDAFDVLD
jgi:hypothetical protein